MFCPYCGQQVTQDEDVCPHCQHSLKETIERMQSSAGETATALRAEAVPPQEEPALTASIIGEKPPQQARIEAQAPAPPKPEKKEEKLPKEKGEKKNMNPGARIILWLLILGVVACLVLTAVLLITRPAWLPFELPRFGKRESSDYVVSMLHSEEAYDLQLVTAKEESIIYEEIPTETYFMMTNYIEDRQQVGYFQAPIGIVPGSGWLLYQTVEEDVYTLSISEPGDSELTEIFSSEYRFNPYLKSDGSMVILESREGSNRAYVSQGINPAERIYRADNITYLVGQDLLLAENAAGAGESLSLVLVDLEGNEVGEVYDGPPAIARRFSGDYSLLVFKFAEEGGEVLRVFDMSTREEVAVLDDFAVIQAIYTARAGSLVSVIAEDEDGLLSLLYLHEGEWITVFSGQMELSVTPDPSGSHLIVLTIEEEEQETILWVIDTLQEDFEEIYRSTNQLTLHTTAVTLPDHFIVTDLDEDGVALFLSFGYDGQEPVTLFEAEGLVNAYPRMDRGWVIIDHTDEDGFRRMWMTKPDSEDGFLLMEDYVSTSLLDIHPKQDEALVAAVEDAGDEVELFWVELQDGGQETLLDDNAMNYWNAFFMPNEEAAIYTTRTGTRYYDWEVNKVALEDRARAELLFDEARIEAVAWKFNDMRQRASLLPVETRSSSLAKLLQLDQVNEVAIVKDAVETQFRLKLQPDSFYDIYVSAPEGTKFNPSLILYNKDMEVLKEFNSYEHTYELFLFNPKGESEFILDVKNLASPDDDLTVNINIQTIPVASLVIGSSVDGEIGADDFRSPPLESGENWYTSVYRFEVDEDQTIDFNLYTSTQLGHYFYILDEDIMYVIGQFSGNEGVFSTGWTFNEAGTYYLIVGQFSLVDGVDYDATLDHSYTLTAY